MLLHKSVSAVKHRRSRLGIVTRKIKQKKWSPAEDQLLGSAPDSEIARRLGCHKFVVQARRLRLKIIAHRRSWKAKRTGCWGNCLTRKYSQLAPPRLRLKIIAHRRSWKAKRTGCWGNCLTRNATPSLVAACRPFDTMPCWNV